MHAEKTDMSRHSDRSKPEGVARKGATTRRGNSSLLALLVRPAVNVFFCMAMLAGTARGAEYFVATNGADSRVGTGGWGDALLTISNAVAKATTAGDIITVSNGTYNISAQISVSVAVNIRSFGNGVTGGLDNAAATIVKRSGGNCRIFSITANATLDGFTIRDGNQYSGPGAGVYMTASGAIVKNCIITGNYNTYYNLHRGGGVYMSGGVVSNCTISLNTIEFWSNNEGGGVFMDGGLLVACRIQDNNAEQGGGGVYVNNANATVRNCLITGNKSGYLDRCDGHGGGVYIAAGTVENCTIVTNSANRTSATGAYGGGIYRSGGTVTNCIVYNNRSVSSTYSNIYATAGVAYTCTTNPVVAGSGNISADPLFVNPAQTNYTLQANSPCIDTGTNQTWMTGAKDLAGGDRILKGDKGKIVDMGCYETYVPPKGTMIILR